MAETPHLLTCTTVGCGARLPADQMYIDQTTRPTAFYPLCPTHAPSAEETLERHEYTDGQGRRVYWVEATRVYPGSGQRVGRQIEWGYVEAVPLCGICHAQPATDDGGLCGDCYAHYQDHADAPCPRCPATMQGTEESAS